MTKPLKILLGGVPFGCNNAGDEAILECVVNIVREARPDAAITVSTGDGPAAAKKLGVAVRPLFGFDEPYARKAMEEALRAHDVFIWSGATGLSDYPEIPLDMLRIAQAAGNKTVLWGVGMNSELNPVKYTVLPGKRRKLLSLVGAATLGVVDAVALEERRRQNRAKAKINTYVGAADLVVVRDPETRGELQKCGVRREIIVGADSALALEAAPFDAAAQGGNASALFAADLKRVGVCISAQREVKRRDRLVAYLDRVVEDGAAAIIFVPMNPLTDAALMADLHAAMQHPNRAAVLEGNKGPGEILGALSQLDAVVSSRLHLLILASIAHVPIIGISRGSKVDNFLRPFGLAPAASVEHCDFDLLWAETQRLLGDREAFTIKSREVRAGMLERLANAKQALRTLLQ